MRIALSFIAAWLAELSAIGAFPAGAAREHTRVPPVKRLQASIWAPWATLPKLIEHCVDSGIDASLASSHRVAL